MWTSRFFQRDLTRFFRDHAEIVQWTPAAPCSCGSTPQAPANPACAACGGLGYFYPDPLQTTRLVLTRITQQEVLRTEGLAQPGDLWADQPPGTPSLAPWDLVLTTWTTGQPFQGVQLVRGTGTTDTLPYRAAQVRACLQVNPQTGAVTTYTEGVDFTVSGKTITWLGTANQPAAGSVYSVRYNATYEWVVLPPGLVRIERGTDLGPRTILRKREYVLLNAPGPLLPG